MVSNKVAWLLLKIQANETNADAISDALMSIGALSASIEDANAETAAEQDRKSVV